MPLAKEKHFTKKTVSSGVWHFSVSVRVPVFPLGLIFSNGEKRYALPGLCSCAAEH